MGQTQYLQRWTSVGGNNVTVVQDEEDWLDVTDWKDVAIYTQVSFVTPQALTTKLQIQTSPTIEDALFSAGVSNPYIAQYSFATSPTLGMQTIQVVRFGDTGLTGAPLGTKLRWRVILPAAETAIMFRILLTLNQAGRGGMSWRT